MKKLDLFLLCIVVVLLVAAFSPECVSSVKAAGAIQPGAVDPARVGGGGSPLSPAAYLAIGLTALLFGSLTFLPFLSPDNKQPAAHR